ncbi:FUSC family protein [Rugosimonospora acidiphila]|uniref:FUSC family protein n=1 Tax=Rugosimonospora acidiphila TaxID=556531 RepID=A0ABP9SEL3_9ACTN
MIGAGIVNRLRRRDPDHRIILRSVRLTIVTVPGYYVCLYGLDDAILATYVVFGVISAGLFIELPGRPSSRARALLAAIPAAWALLSLATALDIRTLWAVAATLVIGFSVAFFGVGGPRLVGLAAGLQLFFIVAVFPAQHANALPSRLIGATVGVGLVAAAEVLLWPEPTPVPYERRLAEAVAAVADLLNACGNVLAGRPGGREELARQRDRAARAVEVTRIAGFRRTERPTSASRHDRGLRDAAATTREVAEQVWRFGSRPELRDHVDDAMAGWMRRYAESMRRSSRRLTGQRPAGGDEPDPRVPELEPGTGGPPERSEFHRLRLWTSLRTLGEHVEGVGMAVGVALGEPPWFEGESRPGGSGAFWYAGHNDVALFWRQLRAHLTPRSVYFQGALRLAVALAAARLVAAELRLSHGLWVLLGTLTVMRTSAFNTRTTLVSAAFGTVIGAVITGVLLRFASGPVPFSFEFLGATLLSYAVVPMLGMIWGQAALTIMITLVFAQLAPANVGLARVRLIDVAIGGAIGVAAGLLLWPRGAGGELRRRVGSYLRAGADLIEETVAVVAGDRERYRVEEPRTLSAARAEYVLADASLCLYYLERPQARMSHVNWDASMVAGHHILHGAELLLRGDEVGALASWPEATAALTQIARALRSGYLDLARQLPTGRIARPVTIPLAGEAIAERAAGIITAGGGRPEDACLVQVADWLADLSENLSWIQTVSGRPTEGPSLDRPT